MVHTPIHGLCSQQKDILTFILYFPSISPRFSLILSHVTHPGFVIWSYLSSLIQFLLQRSPHHPSFFRFLFLFLFSCPLIFSIISLRIHLSFNRIHPHTSTIFSMTNSDCRRMIRRPFLHHLFYFLFSSPFPLLSLSVLSRFGPSWVNSPTLHLSVWQQACLFFPVGPLETSIMLNDT